MPFVLLFLVWAQATNPSFTPESLCHVLFSAISTCSLYHQRHQQTVAIDLNHIKNKFKSIPKKHLSFCQLSKNNTNEELALIVTDLLEERGKGEIGANRRSLDWEGVKDECQMDPSRGGEGVGL